MRYFRIHIFRSAKKNLITYVGAVLIIALGIFIYAAMIDTLKNLTSQTSSYYEERHLADLFVAVKGISESELQRLTDIEGIEAIEGKLSADVRISGDKIKDIAGVHLIGYEPDGLNIAAIVQSDENKATAVSAAPPAIDSANIYVGLKMYNAYDFNSEDSINIIVDGNAYSFKTAGYSLAPDYIYSVPPNGAMLPDDKLYDIAYVDNSILEEILNMKGAVNEIGIALKPGYEAKDVKYELSGRLKNYGLISVTERKDQASYNRVQGEMDELSTTGTVIPFMFLSVSIFMLYIFLKKIVDSDRVLIGTMKAFGMTDAELILSYMSQGIVIGILGAFTGVAVSVPFGKFMLGMYVNYFTLPNTVYKTFFSTQLTSLCISLFVSILSIYLGVRQISHIEPAEAMRRAAPDIDVSESLLNKYIQKFSGMFKMSVRFILRNRLRSFVVVFAIAFPFAMASVLTSYPQLINQMLFDQIEKVEVYDLRASIENFGEYNAVSEAIDSIKGVKSSAAICETPISLTYNNHTEYTVLVGLKAHNGLRNIYDNTGNVYTPGNELILGGITAKKLGIVAGDYVEITPVRLTTDTVKIRISKIIDESVGSNAYLDINSFAGYFGYNRPVNTLLIKTEKGRTDSVKESLYDAGRVTYISDASETLQNYKDMLVNMIFMMNMFIVLTAVAGIVLIYNISLIGVRERITEFATLMIMGLSDAELNELIFFEQVIYLIFGFLFGLPLSLLFKGIIEQLILSANYSVKLSVGISNYLVSLALCTVILLVSGMSVLKNIKKIDPKDSLGERA